MFLEIISPNKNKMLYSWRNNFRICRTAPGVANRSLVLFIVYCGACFRVTFPGKPTVVRSCYRKKRATPDIVTARPRISLGVMR